MSTNVPRPLMPDLDRSNACLARSSAVLGRLQCHQDVAHRGGHEAPLAGGVLYVWYDEKDTIRHWDSPCECDQPLKAHAVKGDRCPGRDGRFRAKVFDRSSS